MRHAATLIIILLTAFTLGACGGDDSGDSNGPEVGPDGFPKFAPSKDLPAMVDTEGMTEAQLEAKIEELEALHDAKMEEMGKLVKERGGGAPTGPEARKIMQMNDDMKVLREQMVKYEAALDALDR